MEAAPEMRELLTSAVAAVLTTYRADGSAVPTPVWFRATDTSVEVVIGETDVKLRRLAAGQRCSLTVFETVPPFRGVRFDATPVLSRGDVAPVRREIASRYLGAADGARFAAQRGPGVVASWALEVGHTWDLRAILP